MPSLFIGDHEDIISIYPTLPFVERYEKQENIPHYILFLTYSSNLDHFQCNIF